MASAINTVASAINNGASVFNIIVSVISIIAFVFYILAPAFHIGASVFDIGASGCLGFAIRARIVVIPIKKTDVIKIQSDRYRCCLFHYDHYGGLG